MKKIISVLLAALMFSTVAYAHPFSDVSGHWAEEEIEYGYENGIISGYGDGLYKPNNSITRAEFIKMLVASLAENFGFDIDKYETDEHWAAKYAGFAEKEGLIKVLSDEVHDGVNPGGFSAENYNYPIKRWEMAYLVDEALVNFFELDSCGATEEELDYADKAEVTEHYGENIARAISQCVWVGMVKGDENGNFNAEKYATRAQALTIINRFDRDIKEVIKELLNSQEEHVKTYTEIPSGHPKVTFEMEDGGKFTVELYPEYAPQTVANFVYLAKSGFYNGLTFHRVVDNFMAQGGDPNGNGTGGSGENILGEFSANGVKNPIKHERGTISMARSATPNSASCQFFICYTDCSFLDGNYAAFGKVCEGMEVVDSFLSVERELNSIGETATPVNEIKIKTVTVQEQ